jgi:hypothetical protein
MNGKLLLLLIFLILAAGVLFFLLTRKPESPQPAPPINEGDLPSPPSEPVKLIFIHHSTGGNWLADIGEHGYAGGLGQALRDNNYFVSGTNYDWSVNGDDIGSSTDIGHWWNWFSGPNRNEYMQAVYNEFGQNLRGEADWTFFGNYSRMEDPDPTRENEIIMFKSCYPNSHLAGNPNDPPSVGENPLFGKDAWAGDEIMTVANAKGIYVELLDYFATQPDKLFIVITAPPLVKNDANQKTDAQHAANARAFNNWLLNDWLADYPHANVAVFDFYNVLTSSNGKTHDAWLETGNHHRWWNGEVQHIQTEDSNFAAYGTRKDSHPSGAGGQKATAEFVPLLNFYYQRWQESLSTG